MLTLEINDANLEEKIIEKARSFGKTAQQFLKDLVVDEVAETEELGFEIPHLDYRKHIKIIDYVIENEESIDDTPLFQNGMDSIVFAKKLRKEAWQRKS